MNRAIRFLLILLIGALVLWEVIAQGTRTWTKYGLLKQPLPSLTTLLPNSMILPVISIVLFIMIIAITAMAVLRAQRLLGIIPLKELRRHALVVGPTGSGKTTIAKKISEMAVKRNVRVTIIDWKGEYVNYVRDATIVRKINVWDVGGRSPAERAVIAVELLREVTRDIADISSASAALLLKELVKLYEKKTPTTKDVIERIEAFLHAAMADRRLAEANMAAALLRRLYWLQIDEERPDESVYRDNAVTIYDLSATGSNYLKTLYSLTILSKKYYEALRNGTADELVEIIIAEECQNYVRLRRFDDPPSIGERDVYELRGFGIGVVLVCPDPELLPPSIPKDVAAIVSMSADTIPRFALERYLFRASLEEAERTLGALKKAKMVVYYAGKLHYLRRLPRPPRELKLKARPKPAPMVVEVKEAEEKPKVIEVKVAEERTEVESKAVEAKRPKAVEVVEPLRLEEEELEEEPEVIEVKEPETIATEPVEKKTVEEAVIEIKEEIDEKLSEEMPLEEPEPTPKAELRLEEEVKEEPKEAEEKEEEAKEEVSETPSSSTGGWELFGHLLVEDLQAPGRVSVMRCVRCGASAPLTGLKALKEIPCAPKEVVRAEKLTKKCENCGREATASLCDECANVFEKYAETARPMPLRGLGGLKPPTVPGVDGWAWVSHVATFFPFRKLEGGSREWWCPVPGCQMKAKRLIDVVDHFKDAHPVLASRGWYEEFDAKTRRARLRNWQGYVDEEKLELTLEPEVKRK
jgi:energy-coupling factor transporter ATP-binding protein EcfA2